ncbi:MAG: hypothetical protein CL916_08385 [Deltaproteobacteria bacterium]|nr:hypothetical protein [Deltaproteobacteria bacterium]
MNLTHFSNAYAGPDYDRPAAKPLSDLFSKQFIDEILELSEMPAPNLWDQKFVAPIMTFFAKPGKSIRRDFVKLGWKLAQSNSLDERTIHQPCPEALFQIIEVLHSASLIVDDIEDDSMTRRGVPCLHRQIGLGPALNIANWLYFVSSFIIDTLECSPQAQLSLYKVFNRVMLRCHQGQAIDLSYKISEVDREAIPALVESSTRLKTGVLVGFAVQIASIYLEQSMEDSTRLYEFGEEIGLSLQMYDDLSGVTNAKRYHKAHEDFYRLRPTWVWLWLARNESISTLDYYSLVEQLETINTSLSEAPELNLNGRITTKAYNEFRSELMQWLDAAPRMIEQRIDQALFILQERYHASSLSYQTAFLAINKLKVSYL